MPILFLLLWSTGFIFVKLALEDNGPVALLLLRVSFAALIVWVIFLFQQEKLPRSWSKIGLISLTGLLLQASYQIFFMLAIYAQMPAGVLTIILSTQPIITVMVLRESLTKQQLVGLILGFSGLFLVVSHSVANGVVTLSGMGYALLSLIGITYGTICQKKYCADVALAPNLLIQYLMSSLLVGGLFFFFVSEPIQWSLKFLLSITWLTVMISVIAVFALYALLKKEKAVKVTSLLYCLPVLTAIMDYLIFQQVLALTSIIGMMIVILGLLLIHTTSTHFRWVSSYWRRLFT